VRDRVQFGLMLAPYLIGLAALVVLPANFVPALIVGGGGGPDFPRRIIRCEAQDDRVYLFS
jgi:hypothetical protein